MDSNPQRIQLQKSYATFERFWRFLPPPIHGGSKNFFCVKFPKTKPKTVLNSPKRLFQVFWLSTLEMSLSNLALFENAQNFRDKIWNLVSENRNLGSELAPFCFWGVFRSVALRKKFDTDCDPLSRRNLAISLQIALILTDSERLWTNFPRFYLWKTLKCVFFVFSGSNFN